MSQKIDRAQKAERLLNDPEFTAAFDATRLAIFDQIERTPIRDDEGLKHLRICLKLLSDVKANIVAVLNDGKIEEFRIEQQKRDVAHLRDFKVR
jgi:hypothetical protein